MRGLVALFVVLMLLSPLRLNVPAVAGRDAGEYKPDGFAGEIAIDGDFRDWAREDCKGLGGAYDSYGLSDGFDNSRDLLAFYYREGKSAIYLRVDLLDLALGAEVGNLDIYFLLNFTANQSQQWLPDFTECTTDTPWSVAVCIYDTTNFAVYTANWSTVYNHSIEAVAYHSRWDGVEVRVNKDVLYACGWHDGQSLNFQIFTTKDGTDGGPGEIPGKPDIIDSIPVCFPWNTGYLKGYVSSGSTTGTAKVVFLHHGNQFIKNIADFVRDSNGNGFWNVPEIHEKWNLPVNLHVSGTMAEAVQWFRPDFNSYLRSLAEKGIVRMVGGYYTEYIPQYVPPEVNAWSLNYSREYNLLYYNNCIPVAWVPERVYWKGFDRQILDAGYQAVIVDTEDGFKWYAEPSGYAKETKIYRTPDGLKILFISNRGNNTFDKYNIQEQLFRLTDNGMSINLREKFVQLAMDADQEQYYLYMDDWEKVCGNIPDWGGPEVIYAYDSNIGWIAQHQWIECVALDDLLSRNWQPAGTLNIGDCTYFWLSRNMGTLGRSDVAPYDGYNLYDAWYYDPRHECVSPCYYNYTPVDTNTKLGDWKNNTTLIGKTWALIKRIPEDSPVFELAWKTFSNMLYETAWRDLPGGVTSSISYWQKEQAAHIRTAAVYYHADEWLNQKWNGTRAIDADLDGTEEYLLANQFVFCVFERRGGKLVFAVDGNGTQLVGNQPTGYLDERDAYTDIISSTTSNTHYHPGAKYLEGSKTYPFEDLGTENEFYAVSIDNGSLTFTMGTLSKRFELKNNVLIAAYGSPAKTRIAFSPDLKNLLRNGTRELTELINTTENSFGYANRENGLRLIMRNASICGAGTVAHAKYVEVEANGNFTLSLVLGKEIVRENPPPLLIAQIPDTYSVAEDTKKDTLIDLRKYFEDVDEITYALEKGENGSFVNAYIYEAHYLGVDGRKTRDWSGNVSLRIIAKDTLDQTSYSNWFRVEILEVNDPPLIELKTELTGKLSGVVLLEGFVSDVDGSIVQLQYRIDSGEFVNITVKTNWTASIDLSQLVPGKHTLTLRATDDRNLTTEKKLVIEVEKTWTKELTAVGVMVLVATVFAALELFFYWRRKKREKK
ncbi:MAG: hypothetical protein N3F63_07945 [Thermoplasmata archaeon]|nr:hypothetical protein [Thermoplasmata archaeon]